MNVYREILGKNWDGVSPKVRRSHLDGDSFRALCSLDVSGSETLPGKILSRIVSFPSPHAKATVELLVTPSGGGELWDRRFPDRSLRSIQSCSPDGFLIDRFRYLAFWFRLEAQEDGIRHRHVRTYVMIGPLAIRLPMLLSPRVVSREEPHPSEDASIIFVEASMPGMGRLLAYNGIVKPVRGNS